MAGGDSGEALGAACAIERAVAVDDAERRVEVTDGQTIATASDDRLEIG